MARVLLALLTNSSTAKSNGIDNTPTREALGNLATLVDKVLESLREVDGKPIRVNSGYRCPKLNKAVGGSATSQHMTGQAADITGGSKAENKKLFDLVRSLRLPFDQLIWEKGGAWVHVSYSPRNRRQVLSISK
ncbi:MAG: peptidase M15 [Paludibacteraceae bacterium]|nr:peptidase M15 [Paludibacteraceae bacterium]